MDTRGPRDRASAVDRDWSRTAPPRRRGPESGTRRAGLRGHGVSGAPMGGGWPATVDIAEAGAAFGLSRSYAYELVARGEFPAKVIRVGSRHRVITASIIHALSDETAT